MLPSSKEGRGFVTFARAEEAGVAVPARAPSGACAYGGANGTRLVPPDASPRLLEEDGRAANVAGQRSVGVLSCVARAPCGGTAAFLARDGGDAATQGNAAATIALSPVDTTLSPPPERHRHQCAVYVYAPSDTSEKSAPGALLLI